MRLKRRIPTIVLLTLLTVALAICTDLFLFPAEQIGSGKSAILTNHALNAGLWFLLLAALVTVLFMFWHLAIDLGNMKRKKPGFGYGPGI